MELCDICGERLQTHISSLERPYHYTECGLTNVFLLGVEVFRCSRCKEESGAIPAMDTLHRLIAIDLLQPHTLLTPHEFRFIRKEAALGLPELSRRTGIEREVFAAFEKEAIATSRKPVEFRFDKEWKKPPTRN